MAQIYIAFVDTPGLFAGVIRKVIRQKYIHVALSLDPFLEETYSIGRRHPSVPLIAGFEKEDKRRILRAFPDAEYMICSVECTPEQRMFIEERLKDAMENRFHYHYAVLGLPFILWNRPFYQKNHYTCSSFLAKLLEEAGICRWEKHFSLVTPKDFYEYPGKQKIFEGSLWELTESDTAEQGLKRAPVFHFARPAFAGTAYGSRAYISRGTYRGGHYER
ncbi:hypothetical protein B5F07_01555 [Lachnoclostridium sp. An169]|uniref:hypothetical protein n=1 Tax=Lachnoclostridium sp. An169 TaxID=1965569 RepID=UPI000B55FA20|nr:hypothetical protein [Lachnoclostridium sp. An169]OUP86700.1 hypothetical protein B5F07_01555 [Lachnoclostridium sp. An169]